jgi:hypothetical protein
VRDCSQKFITSCQYFNRGIPGEIIENESAVQLGIDEVAYILSFLPLRKIMCLRRVNLTWREAARITTVPPPDNTSTKFFVDSVKNYNAMNVMTTELPNLQQIAIGDLGRGHKYYDGEDPDEEEAARTTHYIYRAGGVNVPTRSHHIDIISNFSRLQSLEIHAGLNGRYPFLFNSFPLLQKLSFDYCCNLKWDLEMLAGLPLLKELDCENNPCLTGKISSLRVLKETLEKVHIDSCPGVEGNFMDLADFPHLRLLHLQRTAVTGDIRDIGNNDFSSLEALILPKGVYGGEGYMFQHISDGPDVVRAVYLLKKQRPTLKIMEYWYATLSEDSPDRYESLEEDGDTPPLDICFVIAASRIGYRWETDDSNPCEVIWLDPEPDRDSSDYAQYIEALQQIQQVNQYRGFHQPPTEEEYHRIWEGNVEEIDESSDEE